MSYADAHRYRVGANYQHLPVNAPRCPFANYQRDGAMATAASYGSAPNYWPNSREGAPMPDESRLDPAWTLGQTVVDGAGPGAHDAAARKVSART